VHGAECEMVCVVYECVRDMYVSCKMCVKVKCGLVSNVVFTQIKQECVHVGACMV
jgi:hypothetical protein